MQMGHSLGSDPIALSENVLAYFDNAKTANKMKRYNDSKLVVNAFINHLATLIPSSEVIVNNFCPGAVPTSLEQNTPWLVRKTVLAVKNLIGRSIQEAGRTVVYASVLAGPESHGKFLQHNAIVP